MTDIPDSKPQAVRHAKGKRPLFSESSDIDQLYSMVLVLASEFCVMRDRIDTIERISAAKGIDLPAEIEKFQPDQAALEARETRRQELLQKLYYLMRKEATELAAADSSERYKSVIDEIAQS